MRPMKLKAIFPVLLLALAVAVLSACGGSDDTSSTPTVAAAMTTTSDPAPYPEDVRKEFQKSCYGSSGGKKSLCDCILKAYEDTISLEDYQKIAEPRAGDEPPLPPQETVDAANACAMSRRENDG